MKKHMIMLFIILGFASQTASAFSLKENKNILLAMLGSSLVTFGASSIWHAQAANDEKDNSYLYTAQKYVSAKYKDNKKSKVTATAAVFIGAFIIANNKWNKKPVFSNPFSW